MSLFFYQDRIERTIYFDEEISHHMTRSLRKKAGDIIYATDGKGLILTSTIEEMEGKKLRAHITDEKIRNQKWKITVACSLLKPENRLKNFLEKATNLGVMKKIPQIVNQIERRSGRKRRKVRVVNR